jgi:hypothetical protein
MEVAGDQTCRICLEQRKSRKNPLIAPCDCRGSVEFIHLYCLNHWRRIDPERNYKYCDLCLVKYKIPIEYDFEKIPKLRFFSALLEWPTFFLTTFHYSWFFYMGVFGNDFLQGGRNLYISIHLFFSLLYLCLIYKNWFVRKRERYMALLAREKRWIVIPFHGLLLIVCVSHPSYYSFCVSTLYLQIYWKMHIHILQQMNNEDQDDQLEN